MERSVPIGGRSHSNSYYGRKQNAVYIVGSQPLSSPSPSWSWNGDPKWKSSPNASHAQFEQLALRMSKLVVDEEDKGKTASTTSSCAASAIFSLTSTSATGSGWTSEAEPEPETDEASCSASRDPAGPGEDTPNARLSVVDGPSLLSKTAPPNPTVTSGAGLTINTAPPQPEDQVSIKIADLGNAARIGRRVTGALSSRLLSP